MTTLRPVAPALEMEWDRWALSTACASRACPRRAAATMRRSKSLMGHQVTRPVAIERARALMKRGPPYLGQRVYRQQLRQPRLYHRPLIRVKHRRNILCRPLTHFDTSRHTQAPRRAAGVWGRPWPLSSSRAVRSTMLPGQRSIRSCTNRSRESGIDQALPLRFFGFLSFSAMASRTNSERSLSGTDLKSSDFNHAGKRTINRCASPSAVGSSFCISKIYHRQNWLTISI